MPPKPQVKKHRKPLTPLQRKRMYFFFLLGRVLN